MIRAAAFMVFPLLAALPAQAQMYKCTHGNQTSYSEAPCERGEQTVLPAPDAPAGQRKPADLTRLQAESAKLQRERQHRDAQQDRADALHDRQAARRREQCAKLELAHRWAEDDVRRATHGAAEAARLKARRAAERHAVQCK
ncbi:DUF4124 domain-containing protein [Pseudoduganella lutea]|uniref:DUF4124 domain-containing protein n=1 Tax=Pseudoduganella lutea TaxID=321985 RepID=A0A4P6L4N2_9BURK|nr:DUF4124 domain-containing protein [Pseudoduganella lutea]QBE66561.1 DUF4124 domain-containing protein [Pseudoduganella lutea]